MTAPEMELLEIPGFGAGRELLRVRAEPDGGWRILSVPACVHGLSRGTVVAATRSPEGTLHFERVLTPVAGATVHCTVSSTTTPGRFDSVYVQAGGGPRLGLGPVSIVEPELVAVHVSRRDDLPQVARYLDRLVLLGVLASWTIADPSELPAGRMPGIPMAEWELAHPHPPPADQ